MAEQRRRSSSRNRGAPRRAPQPVSDPDQDQRDQVARIQAEAREQHEAAVAIAETRAEPAGPPISDEQRMAVLDNERRSAERRASVAVSMRRAAVAVAEPDDQDRDLVADVLDKAREARGAELDERGIVDPAFDAESAGYDPDLVGDEDLASTVQCDTCQNVIERRFPGYPDLDAASRDLVCPYCGARQGAATRRSSTLVGTLPPSQQANAPGTAAPADQLTPDERTELEQLRARFQAEGGDQGNQT